MATDWVMGGNELEPVDRRQNGGKNGGKDEFEIYTLKFSTKSMPNHLKSLTIKNLKKLSAGKHPIGIVPGLYLFKNSNENSSFVLRYTSPTQSKRRYIGLGSLNQVSVKEACEKAIEYKKLISDGIDPIEYKRHQKLQTQTQALEEIISFKKVTLEWHGARSKGGFFSSLKEEKGTLSILQRYAFPTLGHLDINEIGAKEKKNA